MQNIKSISLSAKDFYILLGLVYLGCNDSGRGGWTYHSLGEVLGVSGSQIHSAVGRLTASGLLVGKGLSASPNRKALADFIVHGARYAFPAVRGPVKRGMVTGIHSKAFDAGDIVQQGITQADVWPYSLGTEQGRSVAPLCDAAVEAAHNHPELYRALVAFDVLRLGQVREVQAAGAFFQKSLAWHS